MNETIDAPAAETDTARDVRRVALGLFVVTYGTNVSTPFLALYRDRLGLSPNQTMTIFVIYVIGLFSTLFVAGPISDRYGRRPVAIPFVALSAVASAVLILGRDQFALLLAGRLALGMVSGCVLGVGAAWLQELMGPGKEERAALTLTVVTYVGFGLGPMTSALQAEFLPGPLVTAFIVHALITLAVLPGLFRAPETVVQQSPRPKIRLSFGVPAQAKREFLLLVAPPALYVFAFASVSFALFPVLLADSIDSSTVMVAGAAGTLTALCGVFARPIVQRFGARVALPAACFAGFIGYLLGASAYFLDQWLLLIPAAVVLGACSGTLTAGCLTLLGEMSDDQTRGACVSTFYLLAYPGMTVPLAVTAISSLTSTNTSLIIMCVFGGLSAAIVIVLNRIGTRGQSYA